MATSYESTVLCAAVDDALSGDRDKTSLIEPAPAHDGSLRIADPEATFRQAPDVVSGGGASLKSRGARHDTRPLGQRLERAIFIAAKEAWQGMQHKRARKTIFIAGMQRSGTNMLMEVLELSLATQVIHERDSRAVDNCLMRPPEVIVDLRKRNRAPVFMIKALCELERLNALMQQLAPARTVWVVRHYEDVINSMLVSLPNQGCHLPAMVRGKRDGWPKRRHVQRDPGQAAQPVPLRDGCRQRGCLDVVSAKYLLFELGFEDIPSVLTVAYENQVTERQAAFERIFVFLDLDLRACHTHRYVPISIRRRQRPELAPGVHELGDSRITRFQSSLKHKPRSSAPRGDMNQPPTVNRPES